MNIKRAKTEIIHTVRAYLAKNPDGSYRIPTIRQRPLLLIGPPGVGKTQIMEQAAKECGVGLVSYTITHHTRQSAVGLPFIEKRIYGGAEKTVTAYTMSEILSSVWDKIEAGEREGILFIDEINCVSETLAPTMLQFLQCKTFGNQSLPEGWLIIAAGNPPEYNKSVREFDIVTLDRVRRMEVEADLSVWKEYARAKSLHPAILSYLELRPQHFYKIIPDVDGAQFVTARGWEDLSELIYVYRELSLPIDWELVAQFLQHEEIARDVAAYLDLYEKYRDEYGVSEILQGRIRPGLYARAMDAAFDEKLSLVSLLVSGLSVMMKEALSQTGLTDRLYDHLRSFRAAEPSDPAAFWQELTDGEADNAVKSWMTAHQPASADAGDAFDTLRAAFAKESDRMEALTEKASAAVEYAFDFIENAFGSGKAAGQEMVVFVTELTLGPSTGPFLSENPCDRYYDYNQTLLVGSRRAALMKELERDEARLGSKEIF